MTVLLDSWCWVEYFNGTKLGKKVEEYIDGDGKLFISVINLSEVYKHFLLTHTEQEADGFMVFMMSRCFVIPVEPQTALNAAKTNVKKKWGLGDSLIYESAKAHKLQLVSGDPHFKKEKDVVYLGN